MDSRDVEHAEMARQIQDLRVVVDDVVRAVTTLVDDAEGRIPGLEAVRAALINARVTLRDSYPRQ